MTFGGDFLFYQIGTFGVQWLDWLPPRTFFSDFCIPNSDFETF